MRAKSKEMAEYIRARTTRLFQSIREDRQPVVVQGARRQV
jgi:hypothetical protein